MPGFTLWLVPDSNFLLTGTLGGSDSGSLLLTLETWTGLLALGFSSAQPQLLQASGSEPVNSGSLCLRISSCGSLPVSVSLPFNSDELVTAVLVVYLL